MTWIAGVDGCRSGWVAAFRDLDGSDGGVECSVFPRFAAILDHRAIALAAVDIPIGLSEAGPLECDREARRLLKGRASSVFPPPLRPVLDAGDYAAANALSKHLSGKGLSRQSHALIPKIREVDEQARRRPRGLLREAHPELAFIVMNGGAPLRASKHDASGLRQRRDLLERCFGGVLAELERGIAGLQGVRRDDLYDALALLETARRLAQGIGRRVPADPPCDGWGIPMEITF